MFLSYQNQEDIDNLKDMADVVGNLPNATEVFLHDDAAYMDDLKKIWGPEIYWYEKRGQMIQECEK